jgi:uncharacterized protein
VRRDRAPDRARPEVTTDPRDESSLCLECGLCCDGTVFAAMTIEADERDYVESLGLTTTPDGDRFLSPQPCPAFRDGCCSLYTTGRPLACGWYSCQLLYARRQGTLGHDDCLAVIEEVRGVAREVERSMGLREGTFTRASITDYVDEHAPDEHPAEHREFLLAFVRLAGLGVEYFGYPIEPGEERAIAAGEAIAVAEGHAEGSRP